MKLIDNSKYINYNYLDGWNNNETLKSIPFRWMKDNATLSVYSDKDNLAGLSSRQLASIAPEYWRYTLMA